MHYRKKWRTQMAGLKSARVPFKKLSWQARKKLEAAGFRVVKLSKSR